MKKRAPSLLLALLALAGLLTAGGCSLGRSPRPDFYMLSSPVENVVQSGKEKISGPRVAIGPVSIPGYLDRPQLFLRDGNDVKVELAEFNHWSEPFGEGVTRVLCGIRNSTGALLTSATRDWAPLNTRASAITSPAPNTSTRWNSR